MLSARLVRLIEQYSQEIALRTAGELRRNPEFHVLRQLPEEAIEHWAQPILEKLSYWLTASTANEVANRYRELGRLRFEQDVPLHEAILRFQLLKDKIIEFTREQGFAGNMVQLYAEEELEYRISKFFDHLVYYLVRGYEEAMRKTMSAT